MKHENEDDVFDVVTGFLNQCDAVEATAPEGTTSTGTGGDELLTASHQLLTETEELLALYQPPVNKRNEEVADSSPKSIEEDKQIVVPKDKLSADQRRAIRNAQAAKRRQRYRQHLKGERASLKKQETQLSGQLKEMQEAQAELKARQVGNLAFGAWRALAVRQLEQRLQAEQRQKLLRAEVTDRARMIHQMNVLLQERLQNHEPNPIISWELMKTNRQIDGSELLKSMMSEFDRQYAQTDEVFRDLKFKTSIPVMYDQTRKWHDGVLYFDSADRMEYPYDFEQAAEAISIVMMSDREDGLENIKIQDVKDTFAMKYRMTYQVSPGKHASFVIYAAVKRYREKDRLVFLCRCFTEGCDEFEGFHSDETLWLIVRPSAGRQSSTVLECYSRLVPMRFGTTPRCDENMDNFVKVRAESSEEESNKMMQMMEHLLISK
ncbi:hypothetical protein V7S43_001638 [Phytophthora oleae]|uniref:BZIP domain-containing protein n=1 Tax=Phytophthora oleae TaxID=2107226 RepID=A0ABD3G484_9STRA